MKISDEERRHVLDALDTMLDMADDDALQALVLRIWPILQDSKASGATVFCALAALATTALRQAGGDIEFMRKTAYLLYVQICESLDAIADGEGIPLTPLN